MKERGDAGRWDDEKFQNLLDLILESAKQIEKEEKKPDYDTSYVGMSSFKPFSDILNEHGYEFVEDVSQRKENVRVYNIEKMKSPMNEKYLSPALRKLVDDCKKELEEMSDEEIETRLEGCDDYDDDILYGDYDDSGLVLSPDLDTSMLLLIELVEAVSRGDMKEIILKSNKSKAFLKQIGVKFHE